MKRWHARITVLMLLGWLGGCAGITSPLPVGRAPEAPVAAPFSAGTVLQAALADEVEAAEGRSGFHFLETGEAAYRARLALIEAAEARIDIQYYIWEFDRSGRAMTAALTRAADRGVRVRALIDGFRVDGKAAPLLALARHPNIEVRLYNAFRTSFRSDVTRYAELLSDFKRLNQRMHDKVLAVDGAAAIVGGRNVSDEYFGLSEDRYFYDRDVLIAGPMMEDISASFELFWRGDYALPVDWFADAVNGDVAAGVPPAPDSLPFPLTLSQEALGAELSRLSQALVWADARLIRTAPGPVFGEQAPDRDAEIEHAFMERLEAAGSEVVIQMPYITLTPARREALRAARDRGVDVRLHTNSLASTDWTIVQHGYVQERRWLAHWDVALMELKDRPATCCAATVTPRQTVLHPKTVVFDRQHVFIGSFNLDRRSVLYNSEIALMIDSPALAARVLDRIGLAMQPENSWRLVMGEANQLVWLDETVDPPARFTNAPHTGFFDQLMPWLGYFLPIDRLL
ncbi:MAG: phospholipase D family protein [Parvibaculaceae bacterium]